MCLVVGFFNFVFGRGFFGVVLGFLTSAVLLVVLYLIFQNLCKGAFRKKQIYVHPAGFSWETFTPLFSTFLSSNFLITEEKSKYFFY